MQSLFSLPVLNDLLAQRKYNEALSIIDESVEVLAPHLGCAFPDGFCGSPESALVLAKVYLIQKDYKRCVEYAVQAKELLHRLDRFYYDSIIFYMMECLLSYSPERRQQSGSELPAFYESLREFVLSFIKDDEDDSSKIGFLAEIGEFDLVKDMLKRLSNTDIECAKIINELFTTYSDKLSDIFYNVGHKNPILLYCAVDAYIDSDKLPELVALLNKLPWTDLYSVCFYIEDTYHLPLTVKNENANLILSGDWKQEIMSNFMMRSSKTSFRFLESMAKARAPYLSLCNCIMNAGTTNDTLYRNNKGMINGREWVRFLEFSAIGMIHHGNINSFEILKDILPSFESSNGEPGALMALGLMNTGSSDRETTDYLLNWIDSGSEELAFGACLGLGFNLLETSNPTVAEKIKALFSTDSTIIQESACYALGLLHAGTNDSEVLQFLMTVQAKTDFPRVRRACGIALSLVAIMGEERPIRYVAQSAKGGDASAYEIAEEAVTSDDDSGYASESHSEDSGERESSSHKQAENKRGPERTNKEQKHKSTSKLIKSLLKGDQAHERETAVLMLGSAYVATSNLSIIEAILPLINDGDDDVKRTAVLAIALVGLNDPSICESCLVPLAQNHNMHVRAAVALVLGFFSCGAADEEVVALLEALLYDSEGLVRQSASIGVGFATVQSNPTLVPNYKRVMNRLNHSIVSKSESACVKFGAAIGRSIAELGGRSAIFSLTNFSKNIEVRRVAGAILFLQSWYWYPLISSLSLCLLPTPLFIFDENLEEIDCAIPNDPNYYDYLVQIPESRKSRKFKASKETDGKDIVTPAPKTLKSGCRLFEKERLEMEFASPVMFLKKEDAENELEVE